MTFERPWGWCVTSRKHARAEVCRERICSMISTESIDDAAYCCALQTLVGGFAVRWVLFLELPVVRFQEHAAYRHSTSPSSDSAIRMPTVTIARWTVASLSVRIGLSRAWISIVYDGICTRVLCDATHCQ